MILLELFNQVDGVEPLDSDDPLFKSNWYDAYVLNGERQDTVFFFVQLGLGMEKKFSFNFAAFDDPEDDYLAFGPTGAGDPFKVYAAAATILRDFIEREQPIYVSVEGFNGRQAKLYAKALKRVTPPEGYEVQTIIDTTMIINTRLYRNARRRERAAELRAQAAADRPLQGSLDGFNY